MKYLDLICSIILIVGGFNWFFVAFFGFNFVDMIFAGVGLSKIVYGLVGLAALWKTYGLRRYF